MARTPVVRQAEAAECGLACLAMIYGHYENEIDIRTLRREFLAIDRVGGQGTSLKSLASCASQLGFVHRALRAEPVQMQSVRLPAILHWDMNHFVVLVKTRGRGCVLHDPADGRCEMGWSEFAKHFTGVVLEIWPGGTLRKLATPAMGLNLRELWQLVRGNGSGLGRVVVLSVVLQLLLLAGPWQVQWSLDKALLTGDVNLLFVLAMGFTVLLVLRALTHWLRGSLVIRVGHAMAFQLSSRLLSHLMALPVTWFAKRHTGDVLSRFSSLAPVRELFTQGAATLLVDSLMIVLSLLAMTIYSWTLMLIVVSLNAVYCVIYVALIGRVKRLSMSVVVAEAKEQAHLLESTRSVQSVKVYGQESRRLTDWQSLHANMLGHSMALQRTQLWVGTVGLLCAGAELTLVVYWGAHIVLEQVLTVGMLFAFLSYRGHFSERLQSAIGQLVSIRTLRVHLQRLADIWRETPEDSDSTAIGSADAEIEKIGLTNVRYRYAEPMPWLLMDVNFTIAPGEFVAVIGESGCGKSTLLKLLMGLLPATHGDVRIGPLAFSPSTAARLRGSMGCVLQDQENELFAASLADNVTLFDAPDQQRLMAVLVAVGLAETLSRLPMGLATHLGDMASGLSGGQVQRLLLARALYRQPRYLFLDEPTANLDEPSRRLIVNLIAGLGCTRVVVTHDLEFARTADRIFELRDGCLIERNLVRHAS